MPTLTKDALSLTFLSLSIPQTSSLVSARLSVYIALAMSERRFLFRMALCSNSLSMGKVRDVAMSNIENF
jgi:hypothetical protein